MNKKYPSSNESTTTDRPLLVSTKALERYVGKQDMIINAFAKWCPHCQDFSKVYEEFTSQWLSKHPQIVPLNFNAGGENLQTLRNSRIGEAAYGSPIGEAIQGYPTIIFVSKDGRAAVYKGERSAEPLDKAANDFFS